MTDNTQLSPGDRTMALQNLSEDIYLTEDEYLKTEPAAKVRREYIDGQVYALAGAGYNHNCIAGNIFGNLRTHLKGKLCVPFMSDMKVRLNKDYVYPDVVVDGSKMSGTDMFSENPGLLVEVLSRSTRKTDAAVKLLRYINLPSLQEYVRIESDFVSVQVLRRHKHWLSEYYFLGDAVTFEAIGLTLTVEEIYDREDNTDMNEFRHEMQSNA